MRILICLTTSRYLLILSSRLVIALSANPMTNTLTLFTFITHLAIKATMKGTQFANQRPQINSLAINVQEHDPLNHQHQHLSEIITIQTQSIRIPYNLCKHRLAWTAPARLQGDTQTLTLIGNPFLRHQLHRPPPHKLPSAFTLCGLFATSCGNDIHLRFFPAGAQYSTMSVSSEQNLQRRPHIFLAGFLGFTQTVIQSL